MPHTDRKRFADRLNREIARKSRESIYWPIERIADFAIRRPSTRGDFCGSLQGAFGDVALRAGR
jgi:hypothetical protein